VLTLSLHRLQPNRNASPRNPRHESSPHASEPNKRPLLLLSIAIETIKHAGDLDEN